MPTTHFRFRPEHVERHQRKDCRSHISSSLRITEESEFRLLIVQAGHSLVRTPLIIASLSYQEP